MDTQATTTETPPAVSTGYVYIMVCQRLACCKIGWSRTHEGCERRSREISTYCPAPVDIAAVFAGSMSDERRLHRYFDKQRLNGEWFVLSDDIKSLIRKADETLCFDNIVFGDGAISVQRWNPIHWIASVTDPSKVKKPKVSCHREHKRSRWRMRFKNPVTKQDIKKMAVATEEYAARREAIAWRDEWFENLIQQVKDYRGAA
jgi:hypothetical protein